MNFLIINCERNECMYCAKKYLVLKVFYANLQYLAIKHTLPILSTDIVYSICIQLQYAERIMVHNLIYSSVFLGFTRSV